LNLERSIYNKILLLLNLREKTELKLATMSFNQFIKKKGNYEILNLLKFKGLNYNLIKKEIVEIFSARTLDFRLKELVEFGLLQVKEFDMNHTIKKKYLLTKKGITILSMLELMDIIITNEISTNSINERFGKRLNLNLHLNFNQIWIQLRKILMNESIIYTLKQKKPNIIVDIDDFGITVETEKGTDKIGINKIEDAWFNFASEKSLERNNHAKSTYRSSFILALFAKLPFVKIHKTPGLTIKIDKHLI